MSGIEAGDTVDLMLTGRELFEQVVLLGSNSDGLQFEKVRETGEIATRFVPMHRVVEILKVESNDS